MIMREVELVAVHCFDEYNIKFVRVVGHSVQQIHWGGASEQATCYHLLSKSPIYSIIYSIISEYINVLHLKHRSVNVSICTLGGAIQFSGWSTGPGDGG